MDESSEMSVTVNVTPTALSGLMTHKQFARVNLPSLLSKAALPLVPFKIPPQPNSSPSYSYDEKIILNSHPFVRLQRDKFFESLP